VAKVSGVEGFDNSRLQPIQIADCTGEVHQFHFVSRLLGNMVTLDAFEVQDGDRAGYEFQILGEPDEDMFTLLGRLIVRIRKMLSIKHINDKGDGHGFQIIDLMVRGQIGSDHSGHERIPTVIVDGHEIPWDDFGYMVSSFEGWQFKLEFIDRSDNT
jgi:hypothetical protein